MMEPLFILRVMVPIVLSWFALLVALWLRHRRNVGMILAAWVSLNIWAPWTLLITAELEGTPPPGPGGLLGFAAISFVWMLCALAIANWVIKKRGKPGLILPSIIGLVIMCAVNFTLIIGLVLLAGGCR